MSESRAKLNYDICCLELQIACISINPNEPETLQYIIDCIKKTNKASIELYGYFKPYNFERIPINELMMIWIKDKAPFIAWLFTTEN
jgi:hypothetical protein